MEEDQWGQLVSGSLQRYYRVYQIVDPVWCFLRKNKTPCTVGNLKRMVRCGDRLSHDDLRDHQEGDKEATDLKDILQQLAIICDSFLHLTPPSSPEGEKDSLDMDHAILSFSKANGISKVSSFSLSVPFSCVLRVV